jgi:hypothetical protein
VATWIFDERPDDSVEAPRVDASIAWPIRQDLVGRIAVGDRVYLRAVPAGPKAKAGIVAFAVVKSSPEHGDDMPVANAETPIEAAPTLLLRIERVASNPKEVLQESWFKGDPVLGELRILEHPGERCYLLTGEQTRRLDALWKNTGKDWEFAESLAGLWAFAKTSGGQISCLPGSPVADVALRIGRAVSGVYNKVLNFRALDPRDHRKGLSGGGRMDKQVWAAFYDPPREVLDTEQLDIQYLRLWGAGAAPDADVDEGTGDNDTDDESFDAQGYEPDPLVRKAVEMRAMVLAEAHYRAAGYEVEITASIEPFDLRCIGDGSEIRVEVKGTRGRGEFVEVTIGEVENARGTAWRTDLFVVFGISLVAGLEPPGAEGGQVHIIERWVPEIDDLALTRFRYRVPR